MALKNILIVDDSEEIREIIELFIDSEFEYNIFHAESGNQAMQMLTKKEYFLVISDYKMPDGNGGVLYSFLREFFKKVFFVLSCGDDPETILKDPSFKNFRRKSIDFTLSKPFQRKDVVQCLKIIKSMTHPKIDIASNHSME